MPVRWEPISEQEFEALPPPAKPGALVDPEWEDLFGRLASGQAVRIPVASEKERRGRRLSLGRRAKGRGLSIEIRHGRDFLAVRRLSAAAADRGASPSEQPGPAAGRRPRQTPELANPEE